MDEFWQSCDDSTFNFITSDQSNSNFVTQQQQQQQQSIAPATSTTTTTTTQSVAGGGGGNLTENAAPSAVGESVTNKTEALPIAMDTAVAVGDAVAVAPGLDQAAGSFGDEVTERDKILCLLSHFNREQLDRYEVFRRGAFPKSVIRMIMQTVSGRPVSQNAVIAMAGITKVYIGEIVEEALRFKEQQRQLKQQLAAASKSGEEEDEDDDGNGDGEDNNYKRMRFDDDKNKDKNKNNNNSNGDESHNNEDNAADGGGKKSAEPSAPSPSEPLKPSHIYEAARRLSDKMVHTRTKTLRL